MDQSGITSSARTKDSPPYHCNDCLYALFPGHVVLGMPQNGHHGHQTIRKFLWGYLKAKVY